MTQQDNRYNFVITIEAAAAVRRQLNTRGTPLSALRIGIRGGGCSGFSYVIEFDDDPPKETDHIIVVADITAYIDMKSIIYLNGGELYWEKTLMQQGFKFRNPNEKSNCGCGYSFTM